MNDRARLIELLGIAAPGGPVEAVGAPRDWRDGGEPLVSSARQARLTGSLWAAHRSGAVLLTDAQVDTLREAHVDALSLCLQMEERLCAIDDALAAAGGFDYRVIKGPAIAHLDETDPALRTFGDVDLLVRGDDLASVLGVLESMGAARPYAERRAGFDRRFAKSVTVTFSDGLEIDVHRTLCDGVHAVRVPIDRLYERPERFSLAGRSFAALDHTARVLHAAYHAVLGSPEPKLMSQRDLIGYLASTDDAVEGVTAEAERWGGTAVLHEAVSIVRGLPGVSVPNWASWADATEVGSREKAVVAGQRRDGSSYGRSRLRVVAEMGSWRNRLAYALAVLVPSREHLSTRGLSRAGLVSRPRARRRPPRGPTPGCRGGSPG